MATFSNIGTLHLVEIGPTADLNISRKLYRTLRNNNERQHSLRLTPPTIQKHTPHIMFPFFG